LNGVHNLGEPQAWLFPIFPWAGFAFAGLAIGFLLRSEWTGRHERRVFLLSGVFGIGLIQGARWLDSQPLHLYVTDDFWHTSPAFFLMRVGLLLTILCASYAWCHWGPGQWGFSPLIQLGQTSLLVYWVHIEFVYGRVSILSKHLQSIGTASIGLLLIFLAMLALSLARTKLKGRGVKILATVATPASHVPAHPDQEVTAPTQLLRSRNVGGS
jgi:uncharacterized membrane protein